MASSEDEIVLVTGASGFIATHVIKLLLLAGRKVRGTVRNLKNEAKIKAINDLVAEPCHPVELVEAELTDNDCWRDVVKGCTYIIHIASPAVLEHPKDEDDLIKPAVEGTLSILKAAQLAGTVKRVVLTSSIGAIFAGNPSYTGHFTEKHWTNIEGPGVTPYFKSKTLAEKAAWDFVEGLPDGEKFELAVINPGFTVGPVLCGMFAVSMEVPAKLLKREMPMVPKVLLGSCDVRDVAEAHVRALTLPEAVGNRHIIYDRCIGFDDYARLISAEFKPQGYNVPTMVAPKFLVWVGGLFDPGMKTVYTALNDRPLMDNTRMKSVLGIEPRPVDKAMIEMCYSMIERGIIHKTDMYTGPP